MRVLINEEPAEVEFENTENLSSILDSIHDWANEQELYILEYEISPESDKSPENLLPDEIDTLSVHVGTHQDLILSNLEELLGYLDNTGMFLADRIQEKKEISAEEAESLANGRVWIFDVVETLASQFHETPIAEKTLATLREVDWSKAPLDMIEALADLKDTVSKWATQLQYSLLGTEEATVLSKDFFESVHNEIPSLLDEIVHDLTSGKDADALTRIENIIQFLSEGIMVSQKAEIDFPEREALLKLLEELALALDNQDMVTAADIIDYDLRDLLAGLKAVD